MTLHVGLSGNLIYFVGKQMVFNDKHMYTEGFLADLIDTILENIRNMSDWSLTDHFILFDWSVLIYFCVGN